MKLYGMLGAGQIICAYVIAELELDCEAIFVDKTFRYSDEFRAISPYGRVPVLVPDKGSPIFESLAIILYLLEQDSENKLCPSRNAPTYGRFLSWMTYLATTFYPVCLRWHYPERYGEPVSVRAKAEVELDMIYGHLECDPHEWVAGDHMTVADCYLYMMMGWDEGREERLLQHPKLERIYASVGGQKTIQDVMAAHND
jgi:glutathione S-transferase